MRKAIFAFLMPLSTALAGVAGSGSLTSVVQTVLWKGTVGPEDAAPLGVAECASTKCDRFDLTVNLPGGVWNNRTGGPQIAIRWISPTLGDNLRLYVYRGGSLIASSAGIISTAQSVLIPSAPDGVYRVYVAYDPDSPSPAVAYDGLAEVEYEPNPRPRRQLLPDLMVRPQRNVSFDPAAFSSMSCPRSTRVVTSPRLRRRAPVSVCASIRCMRIRAKAPSNSASRFPRTKTHRTTRFIRGSFRAKARPSSPTGSWANGNSTRRTITSTSRASASPGFGGSTPTGGGATRIRSGSTGADATSRSA